MKKIIFLGYDSSKTRLINELKKRKCVVKAISEKISIEDIGKRDLIISFGYRHILSSNFINNCGCPIVNLHISYLPFNRGAHPNFWSFYDNTPSGVTIHLINEGIDSGPILFQKKIEFDNEITFIETYKRLINEIENLFLENIDLIIEKKWTEKRQSHKGTFHQYKDLPIEFKGWQTSIVEEIDRLKKIKGFNK